MYPPPYGQAPKSKFPAWGIALIIAVPLLIIGGIVALVGIPLVLGADSDSKAESAPAFATSSDTTRVEVSRWALEVRGPIDAWPLLQEESISPTPAPRDMAYYAVEVSGVHGFADDVDPFYELQLIFESADGEIYNDENCGVLPDDAAFIGNIDPNEYFTGYFCTIAPIDEAGEWYVIDYTNPSDRVLVGVQ